MPELLVMRHAKSDHPGGMADIDRPLSGRGERSAALIGAAISDFGAAPDLVLTSPARRAADTASLAHRGGGWSASIEVVDAFYGQGVAGVLAETASRWSGDRVLIVGHEPIWSALVSTLIGGGAIQMVTAAVACVEFAPPLGSGPGWMRWMLHPRLLER
jgi:phosphohistidine phosphatase